MSLVITGARPYGEGDPVDVLVRDGVVAEIGPGSPPTRRSTPTGSCCCRDSSTCTPTCASRAARTTRRSPRARPRRRSAGSPTCSRCPTPLRSTTPPSSRARRRRGPRSGSSTCIRSAPSPWACAASGGRARHDGPLAPRRCGVLRRRPLRPRPLSMRRALEYATALDVVIPARRGHALTGGAQMHEGAVAAARARGLAARRGHDRRPRRALAGDAGRACTSPRLQLAPSRSYARPSRRRAGDRRGHAAPPAAHRRAPVRLRPGDKVNPPLRTGADTEALRAALAEGAIDASPPTTPRTPRSQGHRVGRGPARDAGAADGVVDCRAHHGRAGPAGLAGRRAGAVGAARGIGGLPDQGRPIAVGEPATFALVDPDGVWTVRGAQLASRAANTPFEGMRLPATVVATVWAAPRHATEAWK